MCIYFRQEAKTVRELVHKLWSLEKRRPHLRSTRTWTEAQEWDKVGEEIRSLEAKLVKKEADLFASGRSGAGR